MPVELSTRLEDNNVKTLLASEASLFKARVTARESQKELLQSKVSQLGEEIIGLDAQVVSKAKQLELITGELTGVQDLFDKRLVPLARLTTLQRESARIEGERGQLLSTIAETKTKVDDSVLTWDVSALYEINPDINVFARIAKGYRAPAIQGRILFTRNVTTAKSENTMSYEAGIKTVLFDHRLRFNLTGYFFKTKDLQLSAVGGNTNANLLLNAEAADLVNQLIDHHLTRAEAA